MQIKIIHKITNFLIFNADTFSLELHAYSLASSRNMIAYYVVDRVISVLNRMRYTCQYIGIILQF